MNMQSTATTTVSCFVLRVLYLQCTVLSSLTMNTYFYVQNWPKYGKVCDLIYSFTDYDGSFDLLYFVQQGPRLPVCGVYVTHPCD